MAAAGGVKDGEQAGTIMESIRGPAQPLRILTADSSLPALPQPSGANP
jgi:hypothetical protein